MEICELPDVAQRARYDEFFEACPAAFIQQSTWWAEVVKDLGPRPDRPLFLLYSEDDAALAGFPLYLYEHPQGNVLSSIPQPGPLGGIFFKDNLSPDQTARAYDALLARGMELAQEHQCLALSVITNPFSNDLEEYKRRLQPTYTFENFTQYIELADAFDAEQEINIKEPGKSGRRARYNLKRNLKIAAAAGFTVRDCQNETELRQLYEVHVKRHREIDAQPLDYRLFENIHRILVPRGKARLLLVLKGERIASGCVYIQHRNVIDVLRLNLDSDFVDDCPNFPNTERSMLDARAQGALIYNWQSAPSRESGVYQYKKQWGSRESLYYILTRLFCTPEKIRTIGLPALKSEYPWHYIVPYAVFSDGFEQSFFRKS